MLVFLSILGACGGSPPSVFRRDSSSRLEEPRREACSPAPLPFPARVARFTRSHALAHRLPGAESFSSSAGGLVSAALPGVSPGASRHRAPPGLGGGTSSGFPRGPPRRSPHYIVLLGLLFQASFSSRLSPRTRIGRRLSGCIGPAFPAQFSPRSSRSS